MKQPWIKDSGTVDADGLTMLARQFAEDDKPLVLAAWPDRYEVFYGLERLSQPDRALEIRVVSGEAELWAHRTMLGQPFHWRIADDRAAEERVGRDQLPLWRMEQNQKLDIDWAHPPKGGGQRTTGGRLMHLPISDENAVQLALYIGEDDTGMASICDFRVIGFVRDSRFQWKEE